MGRFLSAVGWIMLVGMTVSAITSGLPSIGAVIFGLALAFGLLWTGAAIRGRALRRAVAASQNHSSAGYRHQ